MDKTMKKAFTLLELVFVIVVIGIIASAILPRMNDTHVQEAAVKLLENIRYTQHLALVDDKYQPSSNNWYKNRWQITFNRNTYSIVSNNTTLYAKDPQTQDDIKDVEMKEISSISFSGGCAGSSTISFDYLGRPLVGTLTSTTAAYTSNNDGKLLQTDCSITLSDGETSLMLKLRPETGYISIVN